LHHETPPSTGGGGSRLADRGDDAIHAQGGAIDQQWPYDPSLRGGAWEYHSAWTGTAPGCDQRRAPNSETCLYPWKEPKERMPVVVRQVADVFDLAKASACVGLNRLDGSYILFDDDSH
jgi:hypothetical protein